MKRRQFIVGAAVAAIVLATIIVMWLFAPGAPITPVPATPVSDAIPASKEVGTVAPSAAELKPDVVDDNFWHDMLESTECELVTGHGPASNTATMLGPADSELAEGGAAFRVIDDTGILFEGELPFKPSRTWLGRHLDGRVLVGFSYLRLNSEVRRDPSSPEPVVVYQDGEKIYQTEKAWTLDIAPDGSAFFIIEPEPDNTSDLIIRDIDGAVVRSHDLEYLFTAHGDELPFHAGFTNDGDEVMLRPSSISQDHIFYPVDGGKPRIVQYGGERGLMGGILASSETGFYIHRQGPDEPLLVVRKEFNWDSPTEKISEAWTTEIDLLYNDGTARLSSDSRYLLLRAWNTHLLDAETGRILFAHPAAENLDRKLRNAPSVGRVSATGLAYRKADRERLASVMEVDEGQDIGGIRDYGFRDGDLYIYREVGLDQLRRCSAEHRDDRDAERACEERLRESGVHSDVLDLFDLASIQIDSQPDRRITIDRGKHECRPGPKSGLAFEDDTLRYVGRED